MKGNDKRRMKTWNPMGVITSTIMICSLFVESVWGYVVFVYIYVCMDLHEWIYMNGLT